MADSKKPQQDTTKKQPNPSKLHKISGGNDGGEFDPTSAGSDDPEFEPASGGSDDDGGSDDLLM